jgi:hypothetical protein
MRAWSARPLSSSPPRCDRPHTRLGKSTRKGERGGVCECSMFLALLSLSLSLSLLHTHIPSVSLFSPRTASSKAIFHGRSFQHRHFNAAPANSRCKFSSVFLRRTALAWLHVKLVCTAPPGAHGLSSSHLRVNSASTVESVT